MFQMTTVLCLTFKYEVTPLPFMLIGPISRISNMGTGTVFSWTPGLGFPVVPTGVHTPQGLI